MDQNSDKAEEFIKSIAIYKNQRSSNLLDSILNRKPFVNCSADIYFIKYSLRHAIWENDCTAYSKLRKKVESKVLEDEKNKIELSPVTPGELGIEIPDENIVWWSN